MKTIIALGLGAMLFLPSEADRTRKCGLGSAFHSGRRAALREKLGDGLVLVRGLPPTRDYTVFRQDKTFWYLTGVESPNAALLMDAKTGEEILFLPKPNKMGETWEGELWDTGDAWVKEVTGFRVLRPIGDLAAILDEKTRSKKIKEKIIWTSSEPHVELAGCSDRAGPYDGQIERDPFDGRTSREEALAEQLRANFGTEVKDMREILDEMRRVKTPEEIDAIRRASRAGSVAMAEAMRSTRSGQGEWEIDALMTFVHRREGADGPAYHAIVGSGPNALALHYSASSRVMNAGEMLLIDYAPELDHYTSDITRSWPIDGKLTPRMEEIYRAVLAAQEAGIASVKPGMTMADVGRVCRGVLKEHGMDKLMPHGACHYLGMEVHDVGKGDAPFVPGVVFTVEPGVYEPSTGIGVRIEDVVVVTEDGCEVLSRDVPKAVEAVLALCAEKGLLDREAK